MCATSVVHTFLFWEITTLNIKVIIEPNEELVKKANELLLYPIPSSIEERCQYNMQLEEILIMLLEHKQKCYEEVIGEYYDNKKIAQLLCGYSSIPIVVTENENIEYVISKLHERKIAIFRKEDDK